MVVCGMACLCNRNCFILKSLRLSLILYLTVVSCGRRPYISNGDYYSHSSTRTTFGEQLYYWCYSGYQRPGSYLITCQASGNWSPRPYCIGKMLGVQHGVYWKLFNISFIQYMHAAVSCGLPPSIGNGYNSFTGTTFGEKTFYSCDNGYTLSGSNNITCQANRRWEIPPVCLRESTS